MAENVVEILVTSRNKTGAGFREAEKDAEDSAGRIDGIFSKLGDSIGSHLKTLGGNLGKGGGLFAGGSGLLAMAGPLGAAGAAMGAFGAIAIPVLTKISGAQQKLTAAQQQYAKATTTAGRASALKAEQQATEGLTGSEKNLMGTVAQLGQMWNKVEGQLAPLVVDVTKVALAVASNLLPAFSQLAGVGGNALETILGYLGQFVRTPFFAQFIAQLGQVTDAIAPLIGQTLVQLLTLFAQLFEAVMPSGVQLLSILLPLIIRLATDLVPVIAAVAQVTVVTLQWLEHTHLLLPVLALVALAILTMEAPIAAVVAAVAVLIAIGVELARNWHQIWTDIKNWAMDAWDWIKSHWPLLLTILLGPIGAAAAVIITHWHAIMHGIDAVIDYIKTHWRLIIAILLGPLGLAIDAISAHWRTIMRGVSAVVAFIRAVWNTVYGILAGPVKLAAGIIAAYFRMIWQGVQVAVGIIRSAWSAITGALLGPVRAAYDTIMAWFRDIANFIGSIPGMIGHALSSIPGAGLLGRAASFFGLATGGIAGAATGGVHGGFRLVGEQGPELVRLPYGSTVTSAAQTQGMLGGGFGGATLNVQLQFVPGAEDMLIRGLRNYIRVKGGNVQNVLGWGAA